jgi:hypothetical protein
MCFKDNVSLFKAINWFFTAIHLLLLVACVITLALRGKDKPLTMYYQIVLTHGEVLNVYLIYIPIFTHTAAILFHFVFALFGATIVNHYFSYNYTNPMRWVLQLVVDGSTLVGIMLIHGFNNIDTIIITIALYASTLGYCYLQDQYLNMSNQFNPDREPHFFALPIYIIMILMIITKSPEHINDEASIQIAIVTAVSLFLTLSMFVLQQTHIKHHYKDMECDTTPREDDAEALENVADTQKGQRIENILDEIRRGIKYEGFFYVNSVVFQTTVTWVIISITRYDQALH